MHAACAGAAHKQNGRIWRIPVSFVIDRAGRLAHNGWDDDEQLLTKEQLRRVVDPLLLRTA